MEQTNSSRDIKDEPIDVPVMDRELETSDSELEAGLEEMNQSIFQKQPKPKTMDIKPNNEPKEVPTDVPEDTTEDVVVTIIQDAESQNLHPVNERQESLLSRL